MKLCHLCTDVCQKTRNASTSDQHDAQQRTCLAIRSITDLLTIQGLICLDFADVSSVMQAGDTAVVGIGEAAGEGRATRAAEAAILDVKRQLAAASTTSETSLDTLVD
jgi:cell division GTPase FtsZ